MLEATGRCCRYVHMMNSGGDRLHVTHDKTGIIFEKVQQIIYLSALLVRISALLGGRNILVRVETMK